MNILYIDHYAGTLDMGMEFRPYYFAREWKKMGHNVRIVGASFSHLRKYNPEISKDFEIQNIDGIDFQWIKTRTYDGNGAARAITMFEFCSKLWLKAKKIAKEFMPDVVIASSTYPLDTYPAQKIARIANCKYVHETHDLWPLTLTELGGMSKRNPFAVIMKIAEKSAYKNADKIVGLLPNTSGYMKEYGLPGTEKFVCIQNGIATDDWSESDELCEGCRSVLEKLKSEDKFIVCYLGGHSVSNALDTLVDAAILTAEDDGIAYVLIGNGIEKKRLIEKADGLENITFLDPIAKKQVPSALQFADSLYVGAVPCSLYRYGVSMNKVYDYMMSAKPIIYGVEAYNNDIDRFDCGITVSPQNAEEIVNAINKLRGMSDEERHEMGSRGRENVIREYEYSALAEKFAEAIEEKANENMSYDKCTQSERRSNIL